MVMCVWPGAFILPTAHGQLHFLMCFCTQGLIRLDAHGYHLHSAALQPLLAQSHKSCSYSPLQPHALPCEQAWWADRPPSPQQTAPCPCSREMESSTLSPLCKPSTSEPFPRGPLYTSHDAQFISRSPTTPPDSKAITVEQSIAAEGSLPVELQWADPSPQAPSRQAG